MTAQLAKRAGADAAVTSAGLELELETPIPSSLPVGKGTALFLFGSCFHREHLIERLAILVDGERFDTDAFGMPRLDLFEALHPGLGEEESVSLERDHDSPEDPGLRSYRSGFWATVPISPRERPGRVELRVEALLRGGGTVIAAVGEIEVMVVETSKALRPRSWKPSSRNGRSGGGLIGVCMATFEPDLELFRIQLDSLRAQTETNWVCLISDDCSDPEHFERIRAEVGSDQRFTISRSDRHLGFYRNFERALEMLPPEAALVAFADQDDRWYPEKLATLRAALGRANLVYSDQRLVDPAGGVVAETYWTVRRNNHTSLSSLLIANTVTGAASLFRREIADLALPFPEAPGQPYHDHWIGLLALATGRVNYVDLPLYDYVQHGSAVLGHEEANIEIVGGGLAIWRKRFKRSHWQREIGDWRGAYFNSYGRLVLLSNALLARCGRRISPPKRMTLRRFIVAERSLPATAWLGGRLLRHHLGRTETLGVERQLVKGILWRHLIARRLRGSQRPHPGAFHDASLPPAVAEPPRPLHRNAATGLIGDKIRPLELSVSERAPERVNVLIPTVDLRHLFGGYIAKFNLARKLAAAGLRVRIVAVDPSPPLPRSWKREIEAYSGLAGMFDTVEVAFAREADRPLEISPSDRFVATTWWSAYVAHDAVGRTSRSRFLYLIQEYEPFTFPMGSRAAIAAGSYELPHVALFSTELLRKFFANRAYGVFAEGWEAGERGSLSFQNAITPVVSPGVDALAARRSRRLLFYARPEAHAERNMFELGLLSLSTAVEQGIFGPEWELFGIGSVGGEDRIQLSESTHLRLIPRQSQGDYGEMLGRHDVGLALMYTPHPSLVPIEMASAGMRAVTNTFETKTAGELRAISPNLVAVDPTPEGVLDGMRRAVESIDDHAARVAGAAVDWPSDWDRAFNDAVMRRVVDLLERL